MPKFDDRQDRANEMFNQVPEYIRSDLVEAAVWARKTLTDHEGSGHDLQITGDSSQGLSCSFAKPSWSGDHSGAYMDTASEAIVIAVCEYLCGM